MKNESIICDGCNQEIVKSQGMDSWYLNLSSIPHSDYSGGVCYDVFMYPELNSGKQFHRLECLKKWMEIKPA